MKTSNKYKGTRLALALGVACVTSGVWAFKIDTYQFGHQMITASILGAKDQGALQFGYSFSPSTQALPTIAPYRVLFADRSEVAVGSKAANHIVLGVTSRDWGVFVGVSAESGAASYVLPNCIEDGVDVKFAPPSVVTRVGSNILWDLIAPGNVVFTGDSGLCITKDIVDGDAHFDNDNFFGSANTVREHAAYAYQLTEEYHAARAAGLPSAQGASGRKIVAARMMLGKSLHTIQDFYAHSNWAETRPLDDTFDAITGFAFNEGSDAERLALLNPSSLAQPRAAKDVDVSATANGGGTWLGSTCDSRSISDAEVTRIVGEINSWKNQLVPIYFYPKGDWSDNDGNHFRTNSNPWAPLTTGYWWSHTDVSNGQAFIAAAPDIAGFSRCDHGLEAVGRAISGIAKDAPWAPFSPCPRGAPSGSASCADHAAGGAVYQYASLQDAADKASAMHIKASYHAALHTKKFLEAFEQMVRAKNPFGPKGDELLALLYDVDAPAFQRPQGWVVDRSATMFDVMPTLRAQITSKLTSFPYKVVEGPNHVLVDFSGSVNSSLAAERPVTTVGPKSQVVARLTAIDPRGGSGCAAPIWEAVELALNKIDPYGDIWFFTDASSSDSQATQDRVKAAADKKHVSIYPLVSGSCSPLDPSYAEIAAKTGGSLFLVEHSDAGVGAAVTASTGTTTDLRLIFASDSAGVGRRTISLVVESGVTTLSAQIDGDLTGVSFQSPTGAVIAANDPALSQTALLNGTVWRMQNPATGTWRMSFDGTAAAYRIRAFADGSGALDRVTLQTMLEFGRPGHTYRANYVGKAPAGESWVRVATRGVVAPAVLDVLSLAGDTVQSFPLSVEAEGYFQGAITLSSTAFRFRVRGVDANGNAIWRMPNAAQAAPVPLLSNQVLLTPSTPLWRAGTRNPFTVNVKNLGAPETVSFSGTGLPSGAAVSCAPQPLVLATNAEINVLCSLDLPLTYSQTSFDFVGSTASSRIAVAVPLRPLRQINACALDINGNGTLDKEDVAMMTRALFGFTGDALIAGLTMTTQRPTLASVESVVGNAKQFDIIGRTNPEPIATVDGLILTRLMLGLPNSALLNGITVPADAQFRDAQAIRANVNSLCGAIF
jgi:hypothetical protein